MAQSDRAAVHVGFVAVQAQDFFYSEVLRGEGLIDFDTIHLLKSEARELQRFLRGGHRPDAPDAGVDADDRSGNNQTDSRQASFFRGLLVCLADPRRPLDHAVAVSLGDLPPLLA